VHEINVGAVKDADLAGFNAGACSLDICRGVTALQLDNMALQAAAV